MVSVIAIGPKVRWFKPGAGFFKGDKSAAHLPSMGSKAKGPMS
jgi:hypothetical protein